MRALPPPFSRLLVASGTSNLADGLVLVGAPLLVIQITRDPAAVAGVQAAFTLPSLLFVLQAGALADRRGRRALLVGATTVRALTLLGVGVATLAGWLGLPLLFGALFLLGLGEVVADTTSQSVVPDLVPSEQLGRANGRLIGVQTVMNNFVGAPLAGLLLGWTAASVLLGPAALYACAALLLLRLPEAYRPPARPPARMRDDIGEGLRLLRDHPALRAIGTIACLLNLANSATFSILVLFVVGDDAPMGLPAVAFGLLTAVLAAGSVLGSFLAAPLEQRLGPRRALLGGTLALAALLLTPVLTARVAPIAAMAFLLGVVSVVVNVVSVTSRQRLVAPELLGRVNAAFRLLATGAMPVGALLGGLLARTAGLRATFLAAVLIQVLAVAAFHRPITDEALRPAPPREVCA